ncbi:ATP-dependent helicase HrpB [Thalassotalea sp. 1_MG-2023]|uniref:ATP-dependent helicase HrpB n=1 Tax=Thalassotalea sp. 1_MG-2023 TaxID=3062680 RepID=UPI0026E48AB7|nr:ATP-dependent helicase HrpB [Thalassotalea sp. 1_MG-2023]MDO6425841.1 ATP-dependent helicase HrpB [Thalassotalea sp. 1_MG-2023]
MLPIDEFLPELNAMLKANKRVVLQAEPGAGKSTAVPLSLLASGVFGSKKIIMLEPRRVAVKSIAHYLAGKLGEKVGQTVGYQMRNERKISNNTRLEIVTEGVLTRRIQTDPELSDVGLIIFDEFHERSIHADLALILSLEVQEAYNETLKMLVMSATIDTQQVSNYLHHAPVMSCPGRSFPVTIEYNGQRSRYLTETVLSVIKRELEHEEQGDILVFLPGQADIKRCIAAAQQALEPSVDLLPLYGGLPLAQQSLALTKKHSQQRRVIFATNIAETSLTIEGITIVIDSGLEKILTFDVKSGLSRLDTTNIAKASASQRAGRAGRLTAGKCIRLWSESEQQRLADYQPEEVLNAELTSFVLELSAWGITQYQEVNWLSEPAKYHFDAACELNQSLGFIDNDNKITALGQQALLLGVEPRLASMLLRADSPKHTAIACLLAALLSERDMLISPQNADITARFLVLAEYLQQQSIPKGVNRTALEQVVKLAKNFASKLSIQLVLTYLEIDTFRECAAQLLYFAFPERLAKARDKQGERYLLANGRGVSLNETDALSAETWLIVCHCDGKNKDGKVFLALPVKPSQLSTILQNDLREETQYKLDNKKNAIHSISRTYYKALTIAEENNGALSQAHFSACLKDILQQEGLSFLNWSSRCRSWLTRAQWLGRQLETFPQISEQHLLSTIEDWLIPYLNKISNLKALKELDIYPLLIANVDWQQQQFMDENAPIHFQTPSGKQVLIRYDESQGPTVAVILQEMFGQLETPKLASQQVPLRFELLSPARRPIQTTSDLRRFWQSSYFDVAKDMRGKYPKHRWPEKPLEEKPGRSIKQKSA